MPNKLEVLQASDMLAFATKAFPGKDRKVCESEMRALKDSMPGIQLPNRSGKGKILIVCA